MTEATEDQKKNKKKKFWETVTDIFGGLIEGVWYILTCPFRALVLLFSD